VKSWYTTDMKKQRGFTVIEVMVALVVLCLMTFFFIVQRGDLEKASRDSQRKSAINAMYYVLTEDYYKDNGYYPRTISRKTLPAVDPKLFTDPDGYTLEDDKCVYTDKKDKQKFNGKCNYVYEAKDCSGDGKCQGFTLRTKLETEGEYKKSSPQKK